MSGGIDKDGRLWEQYPESENPNILEVQDYSDLRRLIGKVALSPGVSGLSSLERLGATRRPRLEVYTHLSSAAMSYGSNVRE